LLALELAIHILYS